MKLGILGLALAVALPAPLALAQAPRGTWHGPQTGYSRNAPDPRTCIKLCEADLNPCDPINFKRTDGRCNPSGTGDPGGGGGGGRS